MKTFEEQFEAFWEHIEGDKNLSCSNYLAKELFSFGWDAGRKDAGQANALPPNAEVIVWKETAKELPAFNTRVLMCANDGTAVFDGLLEQYRNQWLYSNCRPFGAAPKWWSYPPKGPKGGDGK